MKTALKSALTMAFLMSLIFLGSKESEGQNVSTPNYDEVTNDFVVNNDFVCYAYDGGSVRTSKTIAFDDIMENPGRSSKIEGSGMHAVYLENLENSEAEELVNLIKDEISPVLLVKK